MLMNTGILIFAVGHPYYGRMAYNLAVTIRAVDKITPIAVVQTPKSMSHLSKGQQAIFDTLIDAPETMPIGCGCKVFANELTPFKNTLLLDADMLWLPNKTPQMLFDEIPEDVFFTGITEGFYDYTSQANHEINGMYFFWADCEEIKQKWGTKADKIYQWRSEVLFFRKSKKTSQLFATAKKIFARPNLTSMKKYGEGVADELAFNIAAAMHDVHPHVYKWMPSYWYVMKGGHIPEFSSLYGGYYLASFGSNVATKQSKDLYNRVIKSACYKIGHQHVFPLMSKMEWLPQRKNM